MHGVRAVRCGGWTRDTGAARQPAGLLRRRGPRDRHRRARDRALRRPDLRAPRGGAQPPRGGAVALARSGVRGGAPRGPRGRHGDLLGARRIARGEEEARVRRLTVFNATCPLVTKVHMEVQRYAREGLDVILIGHAGHPEVEGTMGRFDTSFGGRMHLVQTLADVAALEVRDPAHLAFVTQTTLSMDDTAEIVATLRQRFPGLATPRHEDICYATQNRQDAVKKLLEHCDVLLVVGSRSSSNSNRLRELADRAGVPGYLIDGPQDLRAEWLEGKRAVGVTAGASAPEVLVRQVLEQLARWGAETPREVVGREERMFFALPRELRRESDEPA